MLHPSPEDYCNLPCSSPPHLVVVIDTEEEFDWSRGYSRSNTAVTAMRHIGRAQTLFDEYKIKPVYVIDYPVASQEEGYRPLQDIHADGRCVIGAHLHPWVNPPFDEPLLKRNSFPGNLPRALEAKKLQVLGERIGERFGHAPVLYKAGRYGIGPHTASILEEQGYQIDLSVCPCMDYSGEGGPDFTSYSAWPYWFGRGLLELPLTVGYTGRFRRWGKMCRHLLTSERSIRWRIPGALARLNLLEKVWLSPEGYVSSELISLLRALMSDGLRVFTFAFHSPSLAPGHTPYVRSRRDVEEFLTRCRSLFDFFMGECGGRPTTPMEVKSMLVPLTHLRHQEDA